METKSVPKDEKIVVVDTKLERWFKTIATLIIGMAGMFGYQKMPTINEGTKISEAVSVVQNLKPEEMQALQGMQMIAMKEQLKENKNEVLAAIGELKVEFKTNLKDSDERTNRRLDKYSERQYADSNRISRIEALMSNKAKASN